MDKPKDYSFYRHVADLKEIVTNKIRAKKVILIGQSFGSLVAAHFIADNPDLVDRVVFSSPGPLQPEPLAPDGTVIDRETLYPTPPDLNFMEPTGVWEDTERMLLTPRIIMVNICAFLFNCKWAPDSEVDGLVNTMETIFTKGMVCDHKNILPAGGGGGGYSHIFSNWYAGIEDPRSKLVNTEIPALVLQGQCDQMQYAYAYEYAALLGGEYVFIEGAGHEIWWEKPQEFLSIIKTFLDSESNY